MSGPPKSIWIMVHESQSGAEHSADKTASIGLPRPTVARYDLADPERDKADAEALRFLGNLLASFVRGTQDDDEEYRDAARRLRDLASRLEGGGQ